MITLRYIAAGIALTWSVATCAQQPMPPQQLPPFEDQVYLWAKAQEQEIGALRKQVADLQKQLDDIKKSEPPQAAKQ